MGLELRHRRARPFVPKEKDSMNEGLRRFKALNIPVRTVIDVGAAAGTWSVSASALWPDCSFVLFEPLRERKEELERLVAGNPGFHFVHSAAGSGSGTVQFRIAEDLDGSGVGDNARKQDRARTVDVTSIDLEIKKLGLSGPYVIKLDTHGFEVPILHGCEKVMPDVALFIIECYGFHITNNSLLFWEMCREMDGRGFRLFDVVDVMRRPKDKAFWQCDAFFIRKEHPLFTYNQYQ